MPGRCLRRFDQPPSRSFPGFEDSHPHHFFIFLPLLINIFLVDESSLDSRALPPEGPSLQLWAMAPRRCCSSRSLTRRSILWVLLPAPLFFSVSPTFDLPRRSLRTLDLRKVHSDCAQSYSPFLSDHWKRLPPTSVRLENGLPPAASGFPLVMLFVSVFRFFFFFGFDIRSSSSRASVTNFSTG